MTDDELRARVETRFKQEAEELVAAGGAKPWGSKQRWVEVEGRRFRMRVPQLRRLAGGPAEGKGYFYPPYFDQLKQERAERLNAWSTSAYGAGVSSREVALVAADTNPFQTTFGMSRSSVSRRFVDQSRQALAAAAEDPRPPGQWRAIYMDGLEVGGRTLLLALGVDERGNKELMAIEEAASEHEDLVERTARKMVKRYPGLNPSKTLVVTDGGAGLKAGLAKAGFGEASQVCIRHVLANVRKGMAHKLEFDGVAARLDEAGKGRNRRKGLPRMRALTRELQDLGQQEAAETLSGWVESVSGKTYRERGEQAREPPPPPLPEAVRDQIRASLPKEMWPGIRPELHRAWAEPDYDKALKRLTAIEERLYQGGNRKASTTLRENMKGTLTVTRLGVSGKAARKSLQSTNPIESLNGQIRREIRKHAPAWNNRSEDMRRRWVAWSAARAARGWKPIDAAADLERLPAAIEALSAAAVELEPRPADSLDPYVELLGVERVRELHPEAVGQAAAPTVAAASLDLPAQRDPFAALDAVASAAESEAIDHAARRVATATEFHRHLDGRQATSARVPEPAGIVALYEREWGAEHAAEVVERAGGLAGWAAGDAKWRSECQRLYAYPFPPDELLEDALDKWFEEYGEEARAQLALERVGRERAAARGEPAQAIDGGTMATNQQSDSNRSRDGDRLRPTFTADRYKVEAGLEPGLPSGGEWQWIGGEGPLADLGVAAGQTVEAGAYNNVLNGLNATTGDVVRNATTLPRDAPEGTTTEAPGHMRGQSQIQGSLTAPEELAGLLQTGNPAQKEEVRKALLEETKAGIGYIAGAEHVAAAATVTEVGEGAEATVRVDWVAVGVDRGKGLVSPFDKSRIRHVDKFANESAVRLGEALAKARTAEVALAAEAAPQVEAEPEAAPQVEVPAQRSASPALPLTGPLALPEKPLTDSLQAALAAGKLRDETARDIWRRGQAAAVSGDLGQLSEPELRAGLPAAEENPFAKLPDGGGDKAALSAWWKDHGQAAVRTAAIEGQLIDNSCRAYEQLAKRESERRDKVLPYPMGKIRSVRDARFANGVEHDAAILASRIGSMSEQERRDRTAVLTEKIRPAGFEKADREDLAKFVALQHGRNVDNAHAAQLEAATPPEVAPSRALATAESVVESGIA